MKDVRAFPHTLKRGDAKMKEIQFPKEVDDFIHTLAVKVIKRAVANGTFKQVKEESA